MIGGLIGRYARRRPRAHARLRLCARRITRSAPRHSPNSTFFAALMAQRLEAAGPAAARRREDLGSNIIFAALAANDIDAYVEYTGTIWATMMKRSDIKSREETLPEVSQWLERQHGVAPRRRARL